MTPLSSKRGTVPYGCIAAKYVKAALDSGLQGDERPAAEAWLERQQWLGGQTKLPLSIPDCSDITIRVRAPLPDANQRLMDAMGVTVVVDERAPPNMSFGDVIGNRKLRLREMAGRRA